MFDSNDWTVVVERPTVNTPWGLRLSGGADCHQPLRVAQVRKRSLADKAGLNIGDFVASVEGVATERLTHRQVLDLIGSQRHSLTFVVSRHQRAPMSSAVSPTAVNDRSLAAQGLLAYLPISNSSQSTPDLTSSTALTSSTDGLYGVTLKPSYKAPPCKPENVRTLKNYQPFDMTGRDTLYHVTPRTAPVKPPQQLPYYGDLTNSAGSTSNVTEIPTRTHVNVAPSAPYVNEVTRPVPAPVTPTARYVDNAAQPAPASVAPESVLTKTAERRRPAERRGQSFWSERISYYDDNVEPRSCAQSRTFYILEALLNDQGSGEKGLPPPPPRTSTLEEMAAAESEKPAAIIGIHTVTRPAELSDTTVVPATAVVRVRGPAAATAATSTSTATTTTTAAAEATMQPSTNEVSAPTPVAAAPPVEAIVTTPQSSSPTAAAAAAAETAAPTSAAAATAPPVEAIVATPPPTSSAAAAVVEAVVIPSPPSTAAAAAAAPPTETTVVPTAAVEAQ